VEQTSATRISLLARLRDACDAHAWFEFDRRYGPLILTYCRARGWQQSDAEDVRQLVMARLFRRMGSFEYRADAGGFRRYLRTVVRNEMARHAADHPQSLNGHEFDARSEPASDSHEEDAIWEREWMHHHFRIAWQFVKQHSDEGSLEIFQRLLAGATPKQIAQSAGMTEAAVRKVKQRVSDRLRAAIAGQILDEEVELTHPRQ